MQAYPSAEFLVVAIAARSEPGWKKRQFTDAQLRAAVADLGDDNEAIADRLGVSVRAVQRGRARLDMPCKLVWNAEAKRRLLELATKTPRPSTATIAAALNATESAVETAMSRFGITTSAQGTKGGKLKDLSGRMTRHCMNCRHPFASEGKHNRLCKPCGTEILEIVA